MKILALICCLLLTFLVGCTVEITETDSEKSSNVIIKRIRSETIRTYH